MHARLTRAGVTFALCAGIGLHAGAARAQDTAMLDSRVTQQSLADTICRPDYVERVSPPLDSRMTYRAQLLEKGGIDPEDSHHYALDHRVPILLGGSPDASANLTLLPWSGLDGERRKDRLAVMLKRCVCGGKMALGTAQAVITGNWPAQYVEVAHMACTANQDAVPPSNSDNQR